jgi:hypothetical protein
MDEEYELLSHDEIERLKKEAEKYKNNPFIKNGSEEKLYASIIEMTKSLNRLTAVFEDVKQQIILEQEHGEGPDAKLDKILDQNKHLAQALVNFGEKIEEMTIHQNEEENEILQPEEMNVQPENINFNSNPNNESNNNTNFNANPDTNNKNNFNTNTGVKNTNNFNNNPNANNFNNNTNVNNFNDKPDMSNFNNNPLNNESRNQNQNNQPNFNTTLPENFSNNTQQNNSLDIDYQAWNYSKPTKPGVSQSKPDTNFAQQNPFQPQGQQSQQPQQNFNTTNQPNNFQGRFNNPNNQELEFPQQGFNPNYPQPEFSPELNNQSNSMPDLKQVQEKPSEKKRRSFGLF